eukprot:Phypoly_transcript_08526.p1 GENE.Phypoly_transcript_08526~~Phypoly_transcript_08526.p1  ORF type:complete len:445 (+),score=88.76 Phypoly_transcript_08526:86-1420(+)
MEDAHTESHQPAQSHDSIKLNDLPEDVDHLANAAQLAVQPGNGTVAEAPVSATTELADAAKELEVVNPPPTSATLVTDQVVQPQAGDTQLVAPGDSAHLPPNKEDDDDDVADQLSKYPPSVLVATKLLIGSWLLKGAKPQVPGTSSPDPSEKSLFNIEVRFLYGRRRGKYEINQPGASLMIDYDFSAISGLAFKLDTKIMVVELSEPPTFSAREEGKWVKVLDFTQGNASYYRRHYIEFFVQNFAQHVERLLEFDPRLKQLAEYGLAEISPDPSFAAAAATSQTVICDWDRENIALLHCTECGSQSYCAECDEVLHRPPDKRHHKRIPTHQMGQAGATPGGPAPTPNYNHAAGAQASYNTTPTQGKKRKTKEKGKKSERCRCGTGATKGTLGEPCTGNRCPCYSEGRGCSSCGCKNCRNPHNDRDEKPSRDDVETEDVTPMVSA